MAKQRKRGKEARRSVRLLPGLAYVLTWAVTLLAACGLMVVLSRVHQVYSYESSGEFEDLAILDSHGPGCGSTEQTKKVAIIIDDLGRDMRVARGFLELPIALTVAILPYNTYSDKIARQAFWRGKEVLLHLPLQPQGYPDKDPGPGSLLVDMDRGVIQQELDFEISSLPHCVGVNNHMGSLFTEMQEPMEWVISVLKERDLFFVDSFTTPNSLACEVAGKVGVPFARRTHFIDDKQDEAYIVQQLCRLADYAARNGGAVGIGHPYPETLAALPKALAAFEQKNVRIVPMSEMVPPL